MPNASPPAATGPAGPLFEAKVAANAMLAMLRGSEPRGLPGMVVDRIKLQRAHEGHPLDDVIIDAHDARGREVTLEIQVKRSITFSPQDSEFRSIVAQIALAMRKPSFAEDRLEFAIATNQGSRAITGSYQDVLSQARTIESAAAFMARLKRPGSANKEMRAFVQTLRDNLTAAGAESDEETAWSVLRHLQIHVYDFDTAGSIHEGYARERASDLLSPSDKGKAGGLWDSLVTTAMALAAVGGATIRDELRADLKQYRFDGDRRYSVTRAAIGEAATLALHDMDDRVLGVMLERTNHLAAIREAAEIGRYVEVRGDAGVGKSGLLRHLAEQFGRESRILVLSPKRIAERGWPAMRGQIQFEGTLHELLSDLACDGGGWIFIDNLDGYSEIERLTVTDILRTASGIPGIIIVATARPQFGYDENWLPQEAIAQLGAAPPIGIAELTDAEVGELRSLTPQLGALLAHDHPARNVTRNLFRLARLAHAPAEFRAPRSELEMAEQWWNSADGSKEGRGDRARLLRHLAARALNGERVFDVSEYETVTIAALVGSETLTDHSNDKVSFRHDVLLEWSIANLLRNDTSLLSVLQLDNSASPIMARAIELYVRFAIEKDRSAQRWSEAINFLSGDHAHATWRRAGLLALVHSEIAAECISTMADLLLTSEAALLRELISLMMAIDVTSVRDVITSLGVDAAAVPESLTFPRGPGWHPMNVWLLSLEAKLPAAAMPAVVDFLTVSLNIAFITADALVVAILKRFKDWLIAIDASNDQEGWRDERSIFDGKLGSAEVRRLEEDIRTHFCLHARYVPEDAKAYLSSVSSLRRREDVEAKLLKFYGTLAQAAPEELSHLTIDALVKPPKDDSDGDYQGSIPSALTFVDHQFAPPSPARGPFFELLTHAPSVGLKLIRDLITRTIAYHSDGQLPHEDNVFVISSDSGELKFPWITTYGWSRSSHYSSITSALMALESWAHGRIEKGDLVADVILDIRGAPDAPAAYLLLIIDMLLSHWPASAEAGVPFISCPELLSFDLSRPVQENMETPDIFGLKALEEKEPPGPKLEELKARVSHHVSLKEVLSRYALLPDAEPYRDRAKIFLQEASNRLGPPEPDDDLAAPRLMVVHAINMLNPENYKLVEKIDAAGNVRTGHQYVPPEAEARHFAPHHQNAIVKQTDTQVVLAVSGLVDHPERSSPEIAATLLQWAQSKTDEEDEFINQAILGAAMIAMRDGTQELREKERVWAETIFSAACTEKSDHVGARMRQGMLYNPLAISLAGRIFALTIPERVSVEQLLDTAAGDAAAAKGANAALRHLSALDARLPRALLRVAFAASYYTWHSYEATELEKNAAKAEVASKIKRQRDAELAWLFGEGSEPDWPEFIDDGVRKTRPRRKPTLGAARTSRPKHDRPKSVKHVDHQSAALWLESLWRPQNLDWAQDLYRIYAPWTLAASGAGSSEDDDPADHPDEWNRAFFRVMANCLPAWPQNEIDKQLKPILDLGEDDFLEVSAQLLRDLDVVYFDADRPAGEIAALVRKTFAERLSQCWQWRRLSGTRGTGAGIDFGPAVAAQFFGMCPFGQEPYCYLSPETVQKSDPFIAVLQELAVSAPSPLVATFLFNWLEVAPRVPQLPLLLAFGLAALAVYPDDRLFWVDHGFGPRICVWLEKLRAIDPTPFASDSIARTEIDQLLARLVRIGVAGARRLELALSSS